MRSLKSILFLFALSIVSCSNETYEEEDMDVTDPETSPTTYVPNTLGDYWVYDVERTSPDIPEMNFTGSDSLYIATSSVNTFTYKVNNDMAALGTMNTLLVNGSLSKTSTTLDYTGSLDLQIDLPITEMPTIENLKLTDLEASNGEILSDFSNSFSETLDIQGTAIPIEINYALTTSKENFYPTTTLNGMAYSNIFEATLKLNISVTGTITVFGISQAIDIIQPQDVMTVSYYYGGNIGLIRAETAQGFELSSEITSLLEQLGETDLTMSAQTIGVEELRDFRVN
jgi:hypothetical protein